MGGIMRRRYLGMGVKALGTIALGMAALLSGTVSAMACFPESRWAQARLALTPQSIPVGDDLLSAVPGLGDSSARRRVWNDGLRRATTNFRDVPPGGPLHALARPVGRLDVKLRLRSGGVCISSCTASLVGDGLILTNGHCVIIPRLRPEHVASGLEYGVRFGYVSDVVPGRFYGVEPQPVELSEPRRFGGLDYARLRVRDARPEEEFGTVRMAGSDIATHTRFTLIGHPAGFRQQVVETECHAASQGPIVDGDLQHRCHSAGGSSGSPIFDGRGRMVALHFAGGFDGRGGFNKATPMKSILETSPILRGLAEPEPSSDAEVAVVVPDRRCAGAAADFGRVETLATEAAIRGHLDRFGACDHAEAARALLQAIRNRRARRERTRAERRAALEACDRLAAPDVFQGHARNAPGVLYWTMDEEKAIPACEKALRLAPDDLDTMNQLATALERRGGEDVRAADLLERAAEKGHAPAQAVLGYMFTAGYGVPKDYGKAPSWLRKAAQQDYAGAQQSLGALYLDGLGVARDPDVALYWFRKSAGQGLASSQNRMGLLLLEGRVVPRDEKAAVSWFRKAADQGLPTALNNLGYVLQHGLGVPMDRAEAAALYRKAAEQGDQTGQHNLGYMYSKGHGVPRDPGQAVSWYRKAAEQGSATAQFDLAFMLYADPDVPSDYEEAARLILLSLASGEHEESREVLIDKRGVVLGAEVRRAVQRRLRDLGHYDGAIDGAFGLGTLRALRKLAESKGG